MHDGDDGHIDGFCWTRVHPVGEVEDLDGRVGEIWVIGVDPQRHRSGLGAALVAAGLDHLSALGLSVAMLFTEESNVAARRMYERMGFHLHERRGGYR